MRETLIPSDRIQNAKIILQNPRKDDYLEPKSYRLMALLSTISKVVESVVSKRIQACAVRRVP